MAESWIVKPLFESGQIAVKWKRLTPHFAISDRFLKNIDNSV